MRFSTAARYRAQFGREIPIELLVDMIELGECYWDEHGRRIAPERITLPEQLRLPESEQQPAHT